MARRKKRKAPSAATLRRNGIQAFKRGDYERAIDAWERAGQQLPDKRPAGALAEAYFRRSLKGDGTAAYEDLKRATDLQPDDVRYRYHLGLAAHKQDDLKTAIAAYRQARQQDDAFAQRAAYPLALALVQQGDDPAGEEVWDDLDPAGREALQIAQIFHRRPYTPPDDAAPLWQGMAAYDDGDHDAARQFLTEALDHSPGLAHTYLGAIAAKAEQWQDAAHHWSQAMAAGFDTPRLPDNLGEVYHRLAEARLEEGDVSGARAAAEEAERFKDDDNQLNQLLAYIYHHRAYEAANRQNWDDAIDYWEMAEIQDGGSFRIAYNLALAHEKEEDFLTAAERWREALRRKPRSDDHPDAMTDEQVARLWQRTAEAYVRAGDFEEAAHVYNLAVKWQPDNLTIRLARAESLLTDGRFQAAENELERILKRDPDYIPALLLRGEVEAQSGWGWTRTQRAANYWERVLELDPDNDEARQRLADLYLDKADEARQWGFYGLDGIVDFYKQALSYRPDDGRIEAQIAQTFLIGGYPDEAQPYIDRALAHNPADHKVYQDIIIGWFAVDELEKAWALLEEAEANIPDLLPSFHVNLSSNLLYNDKEEMARQWLERAVEKAPPEVPIYLIIGEMILSMPPGNEELGIEYLQRAIDQDQTPGDAYLLMGVLAIKMGDEEEAKNYWHKAERIARKNRDDELQERIEEAREMFLSPYGNLLSRMLGGDAPFPPDIFEDDFDDFFEDDDEFYF